MSTRKSTARSSNVQTTPKFNSAHLQGAKDLVEMMEKPTNLSVFLSLAIYWAYEFKLANPYKEEDDGDLMYMLLRFVEHILPAWYSGGPKCLENIALGIREIDQCFGKYIYVEKVSQLTSAFGHNSRDSYLSSDYAEECMHGIQCLFRLAKAMTDTGLPE